MEDVHGSEGPSFGSSSTFIPSSNPHHISKIPINHGLLEHLVGLNRVNRLFTKVYTTSHDTYHAPSTTPLNTLLLIPLDQWRSLERINFLEVRPTPDPLLWHFFSRVDPSLVGARSSLIDSGLGTDTLGPGPRTPPRPSETRHPCVGKSTLNGILSVVLLWSDFIGPITVSVIKIAGTPLARWEVLETQS